MKSTATRKGVDAGKGPASLAAPPRSEKFKQFGATKQTPPNPGVTINWDALLAGRGDAVVVMSTADGAKHRYGTVVQYDGEAEVSAAHSRANTMADHVCACPAVTEHHDYASALRECRKRDEATLDPDELRARARVRALTGGPEGFSLEDDDVHIGQIIHGIDWGRLSREHPLDNRATTALSRRRSMDPILWTLALIVLAWCFAQIGEFAGWWLQ